MLSGIIRKKAVEFWYIALELPIRTVEALVESEGNYPGPAIDISIPGQAANGLEWIHTRRCRSAVSTLCTLMTGR